MVSRNIYDKRGRLKWCIKEESVKAVDNGWRFLSDIDTEEFLADNSNWCILAYETLAEIEPAILAIYDMPIGTDLTLQQEGGEKFFVDTKTGLPIESNDCYSKYR